MNKHHPQTPVQPDTDPRMPDHIRSDFPILQRKVHGHPLVYLDNAATTHKPQVVLDRIQEVYKDGYSNIHRGVHYLSGVASQAYEDARKTVSEFINASHEHEVVFTGGATDSINLVAASFGDTFVQEGDEIIVSGMEHHSNIVPWHMMCLRTGARIRTLPVSEEGTLEVATLKELISPKTRLVCLVYVSHVLGTVNDMQELIRVCHDQGVPVLVDAAQAVQHMQVDVQALDADFFVFSGHKIFSETGIGVLYGKEDWLDKMPPYRGGGGMISSVTMEQTSYGELPFKFEAGTANYVAAISLAAALDYVKQAGLEAIKAHEDDVLAYALARLDELEGLTIYGNPPKRCSVISFNLDGVHHYDAGMVLDKKGIAVRTGKLCAEPLLRTLGVDGVIRASLALYNTKEDVDQLISGLKTAHQLFRI